MVSPRMSFWIYLQNSGVLKSRCYTILHCKLGECCHVNHSLILEMASTCQPCIVCEHTAALTQNWTIELNFFDSQSLKTKQNKNMAGTVDCLISHILKVISIPCSKSYSHWRLGHRLLSSLQPCLVPQYYVSSFLLWSFMGP
jgi:hypothetical protein